MNTILTPTRRPWLATLFSLMTAGASAAPAASNLPLVELPPAATAGAPLATLVWVGIGRASVWVDGAWRAAPAHDYEFSVTQRRHADRWESIKVQHRRHPDYDGSAGARDQAHYFRVDYPPAAGEAPRAFRLQSSLGHGQGRIDARFAEGLMDFDARGVSLFAPYNRYRITQRYDYAQGRLSETVELFKRSGERESPFMRFEEQAGLFSPGPVAGVPGLP